MMDSNNSQGVSPVIGVILMVAVTVALVALVTVIVFDIGGDVSESPDATVDLSVDSSSNSTTATVLRNENVESFQVNDQGNNADSNQTISDATAGSSVTLEDMGGTAPTSGTVVVIAEMSDGSQQVLTSTDYSFS